MEQLEFFDGARRRAIPRLVAVGGRKGQYREYEALMGAFAAVRQRDLTRSEHAYALRALCNRRKPTPR